MASQCTCPTSDTRKAGRKPDAFGKLCSKVERGLHSAIEGADSQPCMADVRDAMHTVLDAVRHLKGSAHATWAWDER